MRVRGRWTPGGSARRRGSVLVLSLVAVTTVVVLSASFSQFAFAVADRQAHAIDRKRAFYMAEAGLAEAHAGFTCGKTGNVGSQEAPARLGHGLFWVVATELAPGIVRLESTGMVGSGRARLALVVERPPLPVGALGVFSAGEVTLGAGSLVDGYDSTSGAYDAQTNRGGATVGSNAGVQLAGTVEAPTAVKGNVTPGVEHEVGLLGSVTVTGSTTPALGTTELPPVEVPDVPVEGAKVHGSPYPLVVPAGAVGFESLSVLASSQVVLQGPAAIVLGSLSLEPTAELVFDASQGPIRLYVLDELELAPGSLLTTSTANPHDVLLSVAGETAGPAAFRASGPFHGVVHAPQRGVVLGSGFELFGAVVADSLAFEGAARLHFDRNLAKLALKESLPVALSWRLVELGNLLSVSADPFDYLGVDPRTLLAPAKAHADQWLVIHYYDLTDVYHKYEGLESEFDWSTVKTVVDATRDGVDVLLPRTTTTRTGVAPSPGVAPIVDGPMI